VGLCRFGQGRYRSITGESDRGSESTCQHSRSALAVITIDGVEYNTEDLSDEIKYMVAQVKDIDDKLGHLRFQVDQLSAAKIAFSDAIVKSITDASQE
jgi:hypothetical protein